MILCNKNILLSQNLVAHFPFDNNTMDLSGNINDGEIIGGVSSTTDRFNNPCGAYKFNGTDGYIKVKNSNSLQSIKQTFSVSCWFKLESIPLTNETKWLSLICKGERSLETLNNPQYRVQTFQSTLQSTISINTDFTEYDNNFLKHKFEFDIWNYYVLVYDGKFVKEYLNNVKIWEFPYNKSFYPNSDPLYIGKDTPGSIEYYSGSIDDLRIYNSPLTDGDISKLFKDESGLSFNDEFTLTCPINIIVQADKNKCSAIVNYAEPMMNINCGAATMKQISGLSSGSEFPEGVSLATFQATSTSGYKKTCTFKITVIDKELPTINCPNDTILTITDSTENTILFKYNHLLGFDNCALSNIRLISGKDSNSPFPIGITKMIFRATDKSANTVDCNYNVIVRKNIIPINNILPIFKKDSLNCPGEIQKYNDSNKCGAIVNYTLNLIDHGMQLIEGKKSGSFFPVGSSLNKFSYSNSQNACSFNVTIIDNEKPTLICPNDIIVHLAAGERTIMLNYIEPSANDNCSIDSLIQIEGLKSGQSFPIGTTQNIFKAIDTFGNYSTCSFNIIVVDTTTSQFPSDNPIELKYDLIPDSIRYAKPIEFKTCLITVVIYDDSQQDFDSISVFFNRKEIVKYEMIKLKKNGTINRAIMLLEGEKNDFIVKAWNNGTISPNTLKVDFFEGYYLDKTKKLKNKKPIVERTLHSKPGVAAGIYLNCKN